MSVAAAQPAMPPVPMRPFTVNEFHRMIEAGVLGEDDRVELLEGWIVPKMVHNPRHDSTIDRAHDALRKRLPDTWRVRVQSAITTANSEPGPDLALVPGPASRYDDRHPAPAEVALVVEVAESSLSRDRGFKLRIYAQAGIETYWIVNLIDRTVEVYTQPTGPTSDLPPAYCERQVVALSDSLALAINNQALQPIPVTEIFSG